MTSFAKVNLNGKVRVHLTERGVERLQECYRDSPALLEGVTQKIAAKGYYETQVWDLMQVFGDELYPGCVMPFKPDILVESQDDDGECK